jgi:hypothetical protein
MAKIVAPRGGYLPYTLSYISPSAVGGRAFYFYILLKFIGFLLNL